MNFFITGGNRGLGRDIVLYLAARGHNIAFTYRNGEEAATTVESEARKLNETAWIKSFQLDQRYSDAVEDVCTKVEDELGNIDVLVNNAAINCNSLAVSVSDEEWQEVLETNLSGPFFLSRQILPVFLTQKRGRFIHLSSVAAAGATGQICYATSKAGLTGLSGTLAREYGRRGITSNVVVAGMLSGGMAVTQASAQNVQTWNDMCPLGRVGRLDEVAGAIAYLASDEASFVNGQELFVTGGMNWVP